MQDDGLMEWQCRVDGKLEEMELEFKYLRGSSAAGFGARSDFDLGGMLIDRRDAMVYEVIGCEAMVIKRS